MKRKLTLFGLLLGVLANLIIGGLVGLVTYIIIGIFSSAEGTNLIKFLPLVLFVCLFIIAGVFNIIAMPNWKADSEKYKRNLWKLIVSIILNFAVAIFCFYNLISQKDNSIFNGIALVLLVLSNTLIIIDLIREKHNII